jgi:AcrR family transcriptional regulator
MNAYEYGSNVRRADRSIQISTQRVRSFLHSDLVFSSDDPEEAASATSSTRYRRAVILACARRIIAEEGCAQVKMRAVAERSMVTPPTIYALVGNRQDVVFFAMKEALERKFSIAETWALAENISPVVAFSATMLSALEADPHYYRHVVRGEQLGEIERSTLSAIHTFIAQQFHDWLVQMQKEERIQKHSGIDTMTVARTLARQLGSTVSYWAQGDYSFRKMRFELVAALLLPVLALASERERTAMDVWVANFSK